MSIQPLKAYPFVSPKVVVAVRRTLHLVADDEAANPIWNPHVDTGCVGADKTMGDIDLSQRHRTRAVFQRQRVVRT